MRAPTNLRFTFLQRAGAVTAIAALLAAPQTFAQEDKTETSAEPEVPSGVVELENDVVLEAGEGGKGGVIRFREPVGAPAGVVVVAPDDEDVFIDSAAPAKVPPKAPKAPVGIERKVKIKKGSADAAIEKRLARLEAKIERMAESDRLMRKKGEALEFNEKEMAKVQREIERAAREAGTIARQFHRGHPDGKDDFLPGGKGNFVFEHDFGIAGDAKFQRKALEAHRKALEKQLESINKRIEALDESGEEVIEEDREIETSDKPETPEPSLPPDSAP